MWSSGQWTHIHSSASICRNVNQPHGLKHILETLIDKVWNFQRFNYRPISHSLSIQFLKKFPKFRVDKRQVLFLLSEGGVDSKDFIVHTTLVGVITEGSNNKQ